MLILVHVDVWLLQDIDVMEWLGILEVQIYEQPMMVHHHYVVHAIHFLLPIKPIVMGWIVPRLMDFDESTINKSDATLELWKCIAKT